MILRTAAHPLPESRWLLTKQGRFFPKGALSNIPGLVYEMGRGPVGNAVELGQGREKWFLDVAFIEIKNIVKTQENDELAMFPQNGG